MMFGGFSPSERHITIGGVRAIWRPIYTTEPYRESNAPVGFFQNADPNPHSN